MFDLETIRARNGQATRSDGSAVVFDSRTGVGFDPSVPVTKGARDAARRIAGLPVNPGREEIAMADWILDGTKPIPEDLKMGEAMEILNSLRRVALR